MSDQAHYRPSPGKASSALLGTMRFTRAMARRGNAEGEEGEDSTKSGKLCL